MASSLNRLSGPVRIVPSGYRHPYFVTSRDNVNSASSNPMFTRVTTHPPLGQWTVLSSAQRTVDFKVLIESDQRNVEQWIVEIWWGCEGGEWSSLPLRPAADLDGRVLTVSEPMYHHWFRASMSKPLCDFRFTARIKTYPAEDWNWAGQAYGIEDGRILLQSSEPYLEDLSAYVEGLDTEALCTKKQASDTPDTAVWVLTGQAPPARGNESGWANVRLGKVKENQRWFALVRLMTPWLAPRHGRFTHELADADAILYSFLRTDGLHVLFVAVSGINDVQSVFRQQQGLLCVASRNEADSGQPLHVVVAVGRSFDSALAAAIYKARSIVSPYGSATAALAADPSKSDGTVRTNWVQDWFDGFAYCTWNGLGKQLTEEKLQHALSALKERGINVTNLIIDDNWQSLDNDGQSNMTQGWKDFEANPIGFPNGLKHAITNIRNAHKDLRHVAVWHALLGYWGGISPEGSLARAYRTRRVDVERDAVIAKASMMVIDPSDASRMYSDFYSFLSSCGVDSVKTDAQFELDELASARDRLELTSAYKTAWTTAHLQHLGGHAISCMSQTPYMLFASQLPNNTPAILVRNSDDFFPNVEESHPWHVFCNAYNALFTKHLNALPDWDMFQTSHKWASFHAASRCLSGGPVYVTDKPGETDVKLIRQMTGQTSRGQTVILRPSVVGRGGDAYVSYDEDVLLKIDSYYGPAQSGAAFSGLFNCHSWPLTRIVHLNELLSVDSGTKYVVRAFQSGSMTSALEPKDEASVFGTELDGGSWEIFTATPVTELAVPIDHSGSVSARVSTLGLISHMTGAASLVSHEASVSPGAGPFAGSGVRHRIRVVAAIKVLGTLGIWVDLVSDTEKLSKANMLIVLEELLVPAQFVTLASASQPQFADGPYLISIDIEAAWKHMKLNGTYTNDIKVEALIGF